MCACVKLHSTKGDDCRPSRETRVCVRVCEKSRERARARRSRPDCGVAVVVYTQLLYYYYFYILLSTRHRYILISFFFFFIYYIISLSVDRVAAAAEQKSTETIRHPCRTHRARIAADNTRARAPIGRTSLARATHVVYNIIYVTGTTTAPAAIATKASVIIEEADGTG